MVDEKLLGRITVNREISGGKPIIRGMPISVEIFSRALGALTRRLRANPA